MHDSVEQLASRECVATNVPSLRDSILFHICYPALTCRAFLWRRFAAGIARSTFLRPAGLQHRLVSHVRMDLAVAVSILSREHRGRAGAPGSPLTGTSMKKLALLVLAVSFSL